MLSDHTKRECELTNEKQALTKKVLKMKDKKQIYKETHR
jgi:hypothetical protein